MSSLFDGPQLCRLHLRFVMLLAEITRFGMVGVRFFNVALSARSAYQSWQLPSPSRPSQSGSIASTPTDASFYTLAVVGLTQDRLRTVYLPRLVCHMLMCITRHPRRKSLKEQSGWLSAWIPGLAAASVDLTSTHPLELAFGCAL